MHSISNDLFSAEDNNFKFGCINKNNETIIPFKYYTHLTYIGNNLFISCTYLSPYGLRYGLINKNSKTIIPFEYKDLTYIGNNLFIAKRSL